MLAVVAGLLSFATVVTGDEGDGGRIVVTVTGLRNGDGQVMVSLYSSKDGFPGGKEGVKATKTVKIAEKKARCEFEGVAAGDYAVAVIHDEDANGKLKTNIIGIPKEGTGASNNPKSRFGPPSWKDSMFRVEDAAVELEIKIQYL